jgi:replicative DNA helicase
VVSDKYDNVKKDDFYFDRREAELIGRLMMSPHELPTVASELEAADFGTPLHRQIWREMGKLYADGKPTDFISILMALEASGVEFDKKHLTEIAELTIGSVKLLAPEVLLGSEKRRFEEIAKKLLASLTAGDDVKAAVGEAQDGLLSANYREEDKGLEALRHPMMRTTQAIEAAFKGEVAPGVSTGFLALDNQISGGFRAGELYILRLLSGDAKRAAVWAPSELTHHDYRRPAPPRDDQPGRG